jgi:hypothetical protein
VTKYEWNIPFFAKIGDPVPGEYALHANDDVRKVWFDDVQKYVGIDRRVFVEYDLSSSIDDTDIHGLGVEIDAAEVFVVLCVKSHLVLLGLGALVEHDGGTRIISKSCTGLEQPILFASFAVMKGLVLFICLVRCCSSPVSKLLGQ